MTQILHSFPTEEEIERVRKNVGTSEEKINEAVEKILEWLSHQPHLPQVIGMKQFIITFLTQRYIFICYKLFLWLCTLPPEK